MATEADLKQMSRALSIEIKDLCCRKFDGGKEEDVDVIVNALMHSLVTLCAATEVEPPALVEMFLHYVKNVYNRAGKFKVECGMAPANKRNPMADEVNDYGPAFGTKPSKYEVN